MTYSVKKYFVKPWTIIEPFILIVLLFLASYVFASTVATHMPTMSHLHIGLDGGVKEE
jgi:hypothetical protein